MRRRVTIPALLGACLVLSGCAVQGSSLEITYTDATGEEQKVSAEFAEMTCTSKQASATKVSGELASVTVHFDDARDNYRGSAWVNGDSLVSFRTDRVAVSRDGDRLTVTGAGDVAVIEAIESPAAAPSGSGFDTENAEEFSGEITAHLVCAQ